MSRRSARATPVSYKETSDNEEEEESEIEIDEEELRKAVIAGHVANFRKTPHGTLLKTTAAAEARTYKAFEAAKSPVARFLPELRDVKDSTRKRVIIEMSDLTHGVEQPCLMDIKMATRTFTEEDAASQEQRADLLAKMLKVNPDAATPAEAAAGASQASTVSSASPWLSLSASRYQVWLPGGEPSSTEPSQSLSALSQDSSASGLVPFSRSSQSVLSDV